MNKTRVSFMALSLLLGLALLAFSRSNAQETLSKSASEDETGAIVGQVQLFLPIVIASGAVIDLPESPYNYANISLPAHFNDNEVQKLDNTPNDNPITDHGATLGRVLFYDKKMSANNTVSCGSCHLAANGFSDPDQFSIGFEGHLTDRNSMGLANARFHENKSFFWDERADTLEIQTLMPIQDAVEMGMTLDALVSKLEGLDYYPPLFENAFGDRTITPERISRALAQFIRSMVSYQSKYDVGRAAVGNDNDDFPNFTDLENQGKESFFANRPRCSDCHETVIFVGSQMRNNGLDLVYADKGAGAVTGRRNDNGKFKAPSLRNIELTAPYMHDGRFATLEEVVEHYNSGVQDHENLPDKLRENGAPKRLNLSDQEKAALVAFMKTLTDHQFITDVKYSDPFIDN